MEEIVIAVMRKYLSEGHDVAIVGWQASYHSTTTQYLQKGGRIRFYWDPPETLPASVRFVLKTKNISHASVTAMKRTAEVNAGMWKSGQIKRILEKSRDALRVTQAHAVTNGKPLVAEEPKDFAQKPPSNGNGAHHSPLTHPVVVSINKPATVSARPVARLFCTAELADQEPAGKYDKLDWLADNQDSFETRKAQVLELVTRYTQLIERSKRAAAQRVEIENL